MSEPPIRREQVHLPPGLDPVEAFVDGYKNGWLAASACVRQTAKCGAALSWGEACNYPAGHDGLHGVDLGKFRL